VARDGDFRIAAKVEGVTFAYVPAEPASPATPATPRESWPPLTSASGEIVVDRSSLDIRAARAQIGDVEWSGVQGRIAELGSRARLDIEGTARGPLADMLRFVDVTPVGRWTGKALAAATATGAGRAQARAQRAAVAARRFVVKGSLALAGNDVA
jgi:uncharacterized protein YhdP